MFPNAQYALIISFLSFFCKHFNYLLRLAMYTHVYTTGCRADEKRAVPRPGEWKYFDPSSWKCQRLPRKAHRRIPVFQELAVERDSIVPALSSSSNYHHFHFAPFHDCIPLNTLDEIYICISTDLCLEDRRRKRMICFKRNRFNIQPLYY